jgi:hypothetical protein
MSEVRKSLRSLVVDWKIAAHYPSVAIVCSAADAHIEALEARVAVLERDGKLQDLCVEDLNHQVDAYRAEAEANRKDAERLDFIDDSTIGTIQSRTYPLADTGDYDVSWTVREYKTDKFLGCGGNIREAIDAAREGGE